MLIFCLNCSGSLLISFGKTTKPSKENKGADQELIYMYKMSYHAITHIS